MEQLEPHEAAGSLLNPLLPDPFLGLIDLPSIGSVSVEPVASPEPAERRLTQHDAWLDPQLPLTDKSEVRGERVTAEPGVTVATRVDLDEGMLGVGIRLVPILATNSAVAAHRPTVDSPEVFFAPSPTSSQDTTAVQLPTLYQSQLPGVATSNINFASLDESIPNEPPQAVDDEITVAEDDSVVFDPTLNDTDTDAEDKLWVMSVQSETDHGRTYWEDGGLIRYIPNPNYQNETGYDSYAKDMFTYTVTDGVDESTATVSVTVTSVNDAPIAANDVGVFINPALIYPPAFPNPNLTYYPNGNRSLFVNDRDYDSFVGVSVGALDMSDGNGNATVGTVSVNINNGTYQWNGPKTFGGMSAFRYKAMDNEGAMSDWVTVRLLVNAPGATADPVDAVPDILTVGDGPDEGNVMTGAGGEDTGAFVILNTQPNSGRLAQFGFDGVVSYLTDYTRAETSFSYSVFSANGIAVDSAK